MNAKKKPVKKVDLQDDINSLTEDLQRIQADFINYKRRAEDDLARAAQSGKESVASHLLPVIDNIERALGNVPKDLEGNDFIKGVQAIAKQFEDALNNIGVQKIKALGAEFDPETMEAVQMEEGEGDKEVVLAELQPGYMIGSYVIRPAMVKVGRK